MGQLANIYTDTLSEHQSIRAIAQKINAAEAFYQTCCWLVIEAYKVFLASKTYNQQWPEPTYTANIFRYCEEIREKKGLHIHISPELPVFTSLIYSGQQSANTAIKYDLYLATFNRGIKLKIGVEAKILVETNILSRNSTHLNSEYISNAGMDKFINGHYPDKGLMIGYVIYGNPANVVTKINKLIVSRERNSEILCNQHDINGYSYCYDSNHLQSTYQSKLKHLILLFP